MKVARADVRAGLLRRVDCGKIVGEERFSILVANGENWVEGLLG